MPKAPVLLCLWALFLNLIDAAVFDLLVEQRFVNAVGASCPSGTCANSADCVQDHLRFYPLNVCAASSSGAFARLTKSDTSVLYRLFPSELDCTASQNAYNLDETVLQACQYSSANSRNQEFDVLTDWCTDASAPTGLYTVPLASYAAYSDAACTASTKNVNDWFSRQYFYDQSGVCFPDRTFGASPGLSGGLTTSCSGNNFVESYFSSTTCTAPSYSSTTVANTCSVIGSIADYFKSDCGTTPMYHCRPLSEAGFPGPLSNPNSAAVGTVAWLMTMLCVGISLQTTVFP
eukprot:TRINITY_DN16115_c0_g1_i1.p1 TRINITY_DN16115_c0_g1~~TRINITY_DN16115_c0_g1_i1.p1  ORF type:complete len:290 (+),score=32.30 TRINITY_DN16115_c0_g1_i1:83-952(+)